MLSDQTEADDGKAFWALQHFLASCSFKISFLLVAVASFTMSLAQDVFEEHVAVISALKDNYARKDDASTVLGIVRAQEEIAQLCTSREEQVKLSIKRRYPFPEAPSCF